MSTQAPTQSLREHPTGLSVFNFAMIAIAALALAVLVASVVSATNQPAPAPTASQYAPPLKAATIGGTELIIPQDWFEFGTDQDGTFLDQVSLSVWVQVGEQSEAVPMKINLMPLSRARPSDYLLDKVYLHQFSSAQLDGPLGLIGKPLNPAEGFAHEEIWYDPLSAQPFVAKCLNLDTELPQARCMRTIKGKNSLAVTFEFDKTLIDDWRYFNSAVAPLLSAMGAI